MKMKAIRILLLVIFSVVALGTLSSCDSPQEDCYKKNIKELELSLGKETKIKLSAPP